MWLHQTDQTKEEGGVQGARGEEGEGGGGDCSLHETHNEVER